MLHDGVASPHRSALIAAYVGCALIWGTTWFAIRACLGGPDGYPTWEALFFRFAIASVILVPIAIAVRPWPRGRATWMWLAISGVLDAVGYSLVYIGEERVSGGVAAVLYGTQPLILALLLAITRLDRVRRSDVIGAAVSIAGVAVLFADRIDVSWRQGVGVLLVLGSVATSAVFSTIMKHRVVGAHPVATTAIFIWITAAALGVVVLVRGPAPIAWPPPLGPTAWLIYLAVLGTVVAFVLFFWLLDHVSVLTTGTLVFVFPIVALVVDAAFEQEIALGARAYAGVAIALVGLAISLAGRRDRDKV
jgi:drug/metabolite transporter (DMT)-like permease